MGDHMHVIPRMRREAGAGPRQTRGLPRTAEQVPIWRGTRTSLYASPSSRLISAVASTTTRSFAFASSTVRVFSPQSGST